MSMWTIADPSQTHPEDVFGEYGDEESLITIESFNDNIDYDALNAEAIESDV